MKALLDEAECRRRDGELRGYFATLPADLASELGLARSLVLDGHPDLAAYPLVVAHEWEPVPGRSQFGKGDLVFADGAGNFAVVEVKHIHLLHTNNTGKRRRLRHWHHAVAQASAYARTLHTLLASPVATVRAFAHTNRNGMQEIQWMS